MKTLKESLSLLAASLLTTGVFTSHADMADGSYTLNYSGNVSPIWDISGSYSETVDSISLDYTIVQDASGKFTGNGYFDIDESVGGVSLSLGSSMAVVGAVKSAGSVTRVTLNASGAGNGEVYVPGYGWYDVIFSYNLKENCEVDPYGQLVGTISGSVKVTVLEVHRSATSKIPATDFAVALPYDSTGAWSLTLNLIPNGTKYTGTAQMQTSTGATTDFTVTGSYALKTDISKLSIKGTGGSLALAGSANGANWIVQNLKGKLYGQTLKLTAP